jgi:hypothetical protein
MIVRPRKRKTENILLYKTTHHNIGGSYPLLLSSSPPLPFLLEVTQIQREREDNMFQKITIEGDNPCPLYSPSFFNT